MSVKRFRRLALCVICALLFLSPLLNGVRGQETALMYKIQINNDGSAIWLITQVQDISGTIDTWEGFQQKAVTLVEEASNITQRQMTVDINSLQMDTTISQETKSKTTEYRFIWQNFTVRNEQKTIIGDVFTLTGFFNRLYGEGAFEIIYTPFNNVELVSPKPTVRDDALKTMEWFRTQDFVNGKPNIILTNDSNATTAPNQDTSGLSSIQYVFLTLGLATTITAALVGFYIYRNRKRKIKISQKEVPLKNQLMLETDEEKILKVIRTNGGTVFQSTFTDQCKFSKAKVSQLLAALEEKGVVARYKKGRDKIVSLTEKGNDVSP